MNLNIVSSRTLETGTCSRLQKRVRIPHSKLLESYGVPPRCRIMACEYMIICGAPAP